MPVQFWAFHFVKQLARKAACTQNYRSGLRHAVQLNPVVLLFWAICSSLALFRRRGWPCAGYCGLVNPSSGVLVCWNNISTHECSQSLGRLLGRAAVVTTVYERIERIGSSQRGAIYIDRSGKIKAA
jgi:hypothetical protein